MAIGQARNEFVQRSKGQNICHKAAYIDRDQLVFEGTKFQDRKTYDYSSREAPIANRIMLPDGVDEKFKDPSVLWNAAEKIEPRHDSQVGMELVIALPDDKVITEEDRIVLTERFSQQFVDKGLAAHFAIHKPDNGDHNWHAHILVPTRTFSQDGQELNYLKDRAMQQELANTRWGEKWTVIQNNYFKELGLDIRVDPKGLTPQNHLGAVRLRGNCLEMLERHEELKSLNALDATDPVKILNAIEKQKSVWQPQDVERFMAKHTPHEKLEEVRAKFWQQSDIVKLQVEVPSNSFSIPNHFKDTGKFSTIRVIEEEKQIIRRSHKINDVEHINLKDKHLNKYIDRFNCEQQDAFKMLAGRQGLYVLEGYAGTGKSYVLAALKDAYEAKGVTVRGFGPDNATANLLKDKGFHAENVPRFLYATEHGHRNINKKELWIVDEAGKLGNQSLNELCRLAHENKAKLVLAGDGAQMPSVDRGGMFNVLAERYDASKLEVIQRQNTQEHRHIAQSFAEGDISKAIDTMHSEKCINFSKDKAGSIENLIVDWSFQHYKDESKTYGTSLILATSNREVAVLNQAAHDVRMAKGELKEEEFACRTSFGEVRVSEGDLIEFRKNDRALGVTNGLRGELIKASEDRFSVQIEGEGKQTKIVSFDPKEYGAWQLGYATTTYRAQGRTVEDAYVLHSAMNGKQTSYVAMSRHQETVRCYISKDECRDYEAFKAQLSKDYSKESTLNYRNDYDLQRIEDREQFDRTIWQAKDHGTRWAKLCAYGREFKANIGDVIEHHRENKADRGETHNYYNRSEAVEAESMEYGASKLPDIKIHGIESQAMRPIEKDMENQVEQQRIQEAVLERQEIQLEKLAVYKDHCQSEGLEVINNIESIFTLENERSVVVLCPSEEAANQATQNCNQEGLVFLSLERDVAAENSRDLDLSILEDRKLLVCGSEAERLNTLEQLDKYDDLHVQTTDYDFSTSQEFEFEDWKDAKTVRGDWQEVDDLEEKLDGQLRLEKAALERQEMQLEKLAIYREECLESGRDAIEGIEDIFTPENERSIVVLCASQAESDEASKSFGQEGFVFVSIDCGGENDLSIEESIVFERGIESDVDLSILEDRKVLVWGEELDRVDILERLADYDNMHVRETDFDFNLDKPRDFCAEETEVVQGDWQKVDDLEEELDAFLGIEKENQRGFELSL